MDDTNPDHGLIRTCPYCGSPSEHESTITEEVIRCTLCPAMMTHDGSFAALRSMWNARIKY